MNPSSLHALIIDRHFGELSPEATELLELHLAENAGAREEAGRILRSLDATREAVLRHPELARVASAEKSAVAAWRPWSGQPWLARAAAISLFAALAGAGGFFAGRSGSHVARSESAGPVVHPPQAAARKPGPWARYRMEFDPAGAGMQVVRVDAAAQGGEAAP